MKKMLVLCSTLLFLAGAVHAQSAEKISELIQTKEATYGQVAYLAAVYQNIVSEDASYQEAFAALASQGLIAASATVDQPISVAKTAHLFAQAAHIQGGLCYRLFHNARYAYKELRASGALPQTADPSATVSGRDAIAILNSCISQAGGAQ